MDAILFARLKTGYYFHFTRLRELDGIPHQIDEHLAQPVRISDQHRRDVGRNATGQLQILLMRPQGERLHDVVQSVSQIEVRGIEQEFAGLDLGEIQNVVDDREQRICRALDRQQAVALLRIRGSVERQLRHPQDSVHGSSDLVAHVGQEFALEPADLLGPFLRFLELVCAFGDGLRARWRRITARSRHLSTHPVKPVR